MTVARMAQATFALAVMSVPAPRSAPAMNRIFLSVIRGRCPFGVVCERAMP
jgi:hypothetical protein